jgi:menaquinone-9 beta-reductase
MLADMVTKFAQSANGKGSDDALRAYDAARKREFSGKWNFERIVGATVGFAPLMNRSAKVLAKRKDMADLLVGVGGDFVPAREVLNARFLARVFLLPTR